VNGEIVEAIVDEVIFLYSPRNNTVLFHLAKKKIQEYRRSNMKSNETHTGRYRIDWDLGLYSVFKCGVLLFTCIDIDCVEFRQLPEIEQLIYKRLVESFWG